MFGGMFSLENDRGKLARLLFSAFIDIRRVIYKLIFSTWEVTIPCQASLSGKGQAYTVLRTCERYATQYSEIS